jgi:hypothetical protein
VAESEEVKADADVEAKMDLVDEAAGLTNKQEVILKPIRWLFYNLARFDCILIECGLVI